MRFLIVGLIILCYVALSAAFVNSDVLNLLRSSDDSSEEKLSEVNISEIPAITRRVENIYKADRDEKSYRYLKLGNGMQVALVQ